MDVEEALAIVDRALSQGSLSNVQEVVFRRAWQGQTYFDIAQTFGYDPDYVKDVGSKLWQLLSEAFGKKVTKSNFQSVLRQHAPGAFTEASHPAPIILSDPMDPTAKRPFSQSGQLSTAPHEDRASTAYKRQDWGELLDVSNFYGRTEELAMLEHWVVSDRCRLVALLGMGGVGKTALAVKLVEKIHDQFDCLIWRSLRNAPPVEELLTSLAQFLTGQAEISLPDSLDGKIACLLNHLRQHRCLIILDNVESVLRRESRAGHYREGFEGYGQLLRQVSEASHQSCLVLTSREKPRGLASKEGKSLPVRSFQLIGLTPTEGQEILAATGLCGSDSEREVLIECYAGNPLALKIVSTTIQDLFHGNIFQFLSQGTLVFGDIRDLLDQQFQRLSGLEKQVLRWLASDSEPVLLPETRASTMPPMPQWELLEGLESLQRRSLIESNLVRFTQQPAIIEYLTKQLTEQQLPAKIATPETALGHTQGRSLAKDYAYETQVDVIHKLITDRLLTTAKHQGNAKG